MELLKSRIIGQISKLLTKIMTFYAKFRGEKIRLFEESEFYLERHINKICRMQHLNS
jgi:hypothetical protein